MKRSLAECGVEMARCDKLSLMLDRVVTEAAFDGNRASFCGSQIALDT